MARINVRIARLETKPPLAYYDVLIAYLKAYRDGDSNFPTFAPVARAPTQLDTAFAFVSNPLPSMVEGYSLRLAHLLLKKMIRGDEADS